MHSAIIWWRSTEHQHQLEGFGEVGGLGKVGRPGKVGRLGKVGELGRLGKVGERTRLRLLLREDSPFGPPSSQRNVPALLLVSSPSSNPSKSKTDQTSLIRFSFGARGLALQGSRGMSPFRAGHASDACVLLTRGFESSPTPNK